MRHLHDLGGGLVLTLPLEADLRNPEAGKYIRKYLHTKPDVDVEDRMRVYNLIRDLTADAYGGWQFVVALQAGGGLVRAAHHDEPHLRPGARQGARAGRGRGKAARKPPSGRPPSSSSFDQDRDARRLSSVWRPRKRSSTLRVICWVQKSPRASPVSHSQLPAVNTSPWPRVIETIMPEP